MHTILGAGGAIGNPLASILLQQRENVRLVGRNPAPIAGAHTMAADLTDAGQTLAAVGGSEVAYLLAGLPYSAPVWRSSWPVIMTNVIAACAQTGARLVFFDNVYMYGPVDGPMTEETPFAPASQKGVVRAAIATQLLNEMNRGSITALIARAADFYGPGAAKTGLPNVFVFDRFQNGKAAQWLVDVDVPHSYTYVPDAARALALLASNEGAFGQTWHLPTHADPPPGRTFIRLAAQAFGVPERHAVLRKWMLRPAGLFSGVIRELYEMLYQNDRPYIFDSSKFERAFSPAPTSYETGIAQTAAWYRSGLDAPVPAPAPQPVGSAG